MVRYDGEEKAGKMLKVLEAKRNKIVTENSKEGGKILLKVLEKKINEIISENSEEGMVDKKILKVLEAKMIRVKEKGIDVNVKRNVKSLRSCT